MSEKTDWWERAVEYLSESEPTPKSLAELLEQQIWLQVLQGDRDDIRVPKRFAELIVAALKRTPASRSDSRISWRDHKTFDTFITKGKRHREKLIAAGTPPLDATEAAAKWLAPHLPDHELETIQRALTLADTGAPYRGKSRR